MEIIVCSEIIPPKVGENGIQSKKGKVVRASTTLLPSSVVNQPKGGKNAQNIFLHKKIRKFIFYMSFFKVMILF